MLTSRKSKLAAAAAVGTMLLGGGGAAFASTSAASTPAGGIIHVFVNTNVLNQTVDPTLITGAIGDYGKSTSITRSGKVDPNGNYEVVALTKGTFEVNATKPNRNLARKGMKAYPNATTCSLAVSASGVAPLFDGTGLYKGIHGSVQLAETFALIFPRLANGKCDFNGSAGPLKQFGVVTGVGRVKF